MTTPKIVRFEPQGPGNAGLAEWFPIDPAGLEAGTPVQHVHLYDEDETAGYLTGVWDCTAMTSRFEPYEVDEFMLLLEGSLTMVLGDGSEVPVKAGEAFVLPKGLPCQWKQEEYVRKYFMILENPGTPVAANVSDLGVILPRASGPTGGLAKVEVNDPSDYIGDMPIQKEHVYYRDPSGQMEVGLWESTPFATRPSPFDRNELMCLLEGSVTLTDGSGTELPIKAGETVYIPKGAVCGWRSAETVRKFYSIYAPANAATT